MYGTLGIHWASALPGFLALACLPFPFLFYKYGAAIRKKCKYSAEADAFMERIRARAQRTENSDDTSDDSSRTASVPPSQLAELSVTNGSEKEESEPRQYQEMKTEKEAEGEEPKKIPRRQSSQSQRSHRSHKSHRSVLNEYNDNPYDIDRVHTKESFAHHPRGRSGSQTSMHAKQLSRSHSR